MYVPGTKLDIKNNVNVVKKTNVFSGKIPVSFMDKLQSNYVPNGIGITLLMLWSYLTTLAESCDKIEYIS